ncbi:hypothetical protein CVT26_007043 [Gymnopilus dilepis]|uniref:Ribosomal RNA methyltransferase FtsJ domain-containing protein n=1 Tax=Gymnopilus dilepis TaxID=231916 RepID=A0A409W029_9AGAR|nr:hypothetical protein CVT26_007043 [Gymnopilus dilepis]
MNTRRFPVYLVPWHASVTSRGDEESRLVEALIDHEALILQRLLTLQIKGWNHDVAEQHFQQQRHTADNASSELNIIWFTRMKGVLQEIDQRLHVVLAYEPMKFLDLGCCPGGFSSYVLEKNPCARGRGISLPVDEGGHKFALENHFQSRFELTCHNLTSYQMATSYIDDDRFQDLPSDICDQSYALILLDGHQLRTQTSSLPWDVDRLLISQMIIALESVKEGGTIVIKLPLPHKPLAAKILYLLRVLSTKLCVWKPRSMHSNRGTFYAVAKGVGKGLEGWRLPEMTSALKEVWTELTFGGDDGTGRFISPEDFDFLITTEDLIASHLDWLMQLGTCLWRVQEDSLRRFFIRNNIV